MPTGQLVLAMTVAGCFAIVVATLVAVRRMWTQQVAATSRLRDEHAREKALRADLERFGRAKDEFLAMLSHELRTPLQTILSWTVLIRSGRLDQPVVEKGLEAIERSARSQARLIDDMLDMSRIISGKMRLDIEDLDLLPLLDSLVEVVRPSAQAKGVHLRKVLVSKPGRVSGDAERMRQVFWNLLSNAVKFTPTGGRVEVRLRQIRAEVEVAISDTGQGIDHEFLPHVFDRFRQADSSTTRNHEGLGLGLAIARHLVEMQGGTIKAQSPGVGRGAVFTASFPLRA